MFSVENGVKVIEIISMSVRGKLNRNRITETIEKKIVSFNGSFPFFAFVNLTSPKSSPVFAVVQKQQLHSSQSPCLSSVHQYPSTSLQSGKVGTNVTVGLGKSNAGGEWSLSSFRFLLCGIWVVDK